MLGLGITLTMARGAASVSPAGFNPSDYGSVALWLRADSLALSDNDSVAAWADSSGEGNDATQATSSKRPVYKAGILNTRPVVRFDGVDDWLAITSTITVGTVFLVCRSGEVSGDFRCPLYLGTSDPGYTWLYQNTGGYYAPSNVIDNRWHEGIFGYPSDANTTWHLFSGTINSPISKTAHIGINGNESLWPMLGDIAEILIYSEALSDANRGAVEAYLTAKYGL